MIADNLRDVTLRISRCCEKSGRFASSVKLVCVSKQASIDQMREVMGLNRRDFGENRLQDAIVKYKSIGDRAIWHLIGHLQTNKVKDAVKIFSLIHSVDSVRLAKEISKEANKIDKIQDILIQVNTSGEMSKFGIAPGEVLSLVREISLYPNINILGLMTIAPEVDDPEKVRPYFRRLRQLSDEIAGLQLTAYSLQLSMGMTNDFEVAIEEGATMVRIGRAIFK
ncbi:MAG: YggS family pyridoxal phosphate-dependent enzyme [Candidatus Omnitrophota bacterium]|nr:YggS family pyridoxal phosphate-dependent enzyme [Candidatus Omnitrophota bacterium]